MKKIISIYSCDICERDLIKRHDPIYYIIEKDMPDWIGLKCRDYEGTILCDKCFQQYIGKMLRDK